MSEKNKKVELNDVDLQEVTGGDTDEQKRKCPIYQHRKIYKACPNPAKGTCRQCDNCDLNVD